MVFFLSFYGLVMTARKSHFTIHCHVLKSASGKKQAAWSTVDGQVESAPGWAIDMSAESKQKENLKAGAGARASGQTLTTAASLVANGLLIEVTIRLAFILENLLHPDGWSRELSDPSTWDAVLSVKALRTRTNTNSSVWYLRKAFYHARQGKAII